MSFNSQSPGRSAELFEAGEGVDGLAPLLLLSAHPQLLQCSQLLHPSRQTVHLTLQSLHGSRQPVHTHANVCPCACYVINEMTPFSQHTTESLLQNKCEGAHLERTKTATENCL